MEPTTLAKWGTVLPYKIAEQLELDVDGQTYIVQGYQDILTIGATPTIGAMIPFIQKGDQFHVHIPSLYNFFPKDGEEVDTEFVRLTAHGIVVNYKHYGFFIKQKYLAWKARDRTLECLKRFTKSDTVRARVDIKQGKINLNPRKTKPFPWDCKNTTHRGLQTHGWVVEANGDHSYLQLENGAEAIIDTDSITKILNRTPEPYTTLTVWILGENLDYETAHVSANPIYLDAGSIAANALLCATYLRTTPKGQLVEVGDRAQGYLNETIPNLKPGDYVWATSPQAGNLDDLKLKPIKELMGIVPNSRATASIKEVETLDEKPDSLIAELNGVSLRIEHLKKVLALGLPLERGLPIVLNLIVTNGLAFPQADHDFLSELLPQPGIHVKGTIANNDPNHFLVTYRGTTIKVPKTELTWFPESEPEGKLQFEKGEEITITTFSQGPRQLRFSHRQCTESPWTNFQETNPTICEGRVIQQVGKQAIVRLPNGSLASVTLDVGVLLDKELEHTFEIKGVNNKFKTFSATLERENPAAFLSKTARENSPKLRANANYYAEYKNDWEPTAEIEPNLNVRLNCAPKNLQNGDPIWVTPIKTRNSGRIYMETANGALRTIKPYQTKIGTLTNKLDNYQVQLRVDDALLTVGTRSLTSKGELDISPGMQLPVCMVKTPNGDYEPRVDFDAFLALLPKHNTPYEMTIVEKRANVLIVEFNKLHFRLPKNLLALHQETANQQFDQYEIGDKLKVIATVAGTHGIHLRHSHHPLKK